MLHFSYNIHLTVCLLRRLNIDTNFANKMHYFWISQINTSGKTLVLYMYFFSSVKTFQRKTVLQKPDWCPSVCFGYESGNFLFDRSKLLVWSSISRMLNWIWTPSPNSISLTRPLFGDVFPNLNTWACLVDGGLT